jgi:hypothetical protein
VSVCHLGPVETSTERDAEELGAREMNEQSKGVRFCVVMACDTAESRDRKMRQVCVCVAGMCVCGRYMPASVGLLSLSMYIVGLFYLALGLFTQCTLTSDRYPCSSFVLLCFVLFPCSHCNVCSTPVTPFSKRGPCIDALRVASTVVSSSSSEAEVERDTMQPEMHHLHTRMGLHPQP